MGELGGRPQVMWPDHCVQGTEGAAFADALDMRRVEAIVRKGMDPGIDSYSGFFDNHRQKSTGLAGYLRGRDVAAVFVIGLATDYCVKFTALDARELGFETYLIEDGSRGVDLRAGDVARAIGEMRAAGVKVVHSGDLAGAE